MTTGDPPVLEVRDLSISVALPSGGRALIVDRASFSVAAGDTLGLVGESGSGKTMTSLAVMGLLPSAVRIDSGEIRLDGIDLLVIPESERQRLRGRRMAMVMQDALTALDPSFTIGSQISDPLHHHRKLEGQALTDGVVTALERVHLSGGKDRRDQYPHQLSGGMRQRVTSAIALTGEPRLLIADEPTTALDVTTEARYLQLLRELQAASRFALMFVAHDLLVVREVCTRVAVMYAGQIVEEGPVEAVFASPQHPYTDALIQAIPRLGRGVALQAIEGQAPEIDADLAGCRFEPRCRFARPVCGSDPPRLVERGPGRSARCWGTEADGWIDA